MATKKKDEKTNVGNNSGNVGISAQAQAALDAGTYGSTINTRTPKATKSSEQKTIVTTTIPVLNTTTTTVTSTNPASNRTTTTTVQPVSVTKNPTRNDGTRGINTTRARQRYAQRTNYTPIGTSNKPSTRYENNTAGKTTAKKPTVKSQTDKEFEEFYEYRYNKADTRDYDPKTDTETEHWRNIKKDLMKKHNWTDAEFERKWKEYDKARSQEQAEEEVSGNVALAKAHPVAGTLVQALYTPQAAVEGAASAVTGVLGKAIPSLVAQSSTDPIFTGTRSKEGMKQAVKDEHIKTGVGKAAYDIATGLGDMGINFVMGGGSPLGLGVFSGAQTAGRTNMQALERGADPVKAAQTGAAAGVVSGLANTVGLDKVLGTAGKTALQTVGKAALKEGAENVVEDAATLAIDKFINKNKSQLNTLHDYYVSQGANDDQAWSQVASDTTRDMVTSFGSGAAFGGLLSGVKNLPALTSELGDRLKAKSTGKVPSLDADIDKAIKQTEQASGEIEKLSQQIKGIAEQGGATHEETIDRIFDETPAPSDNATKELKIETVNRKGGKKGYYVAETDGTTTRNVESGKIYKTEAEAREAMSRYERNLDRVQDTVPGYAAEKAAGNPTLTEEVNHPRYKKPLEGAELEQNKATIQQNKDAIDRLNNEIDSIKKNNANKTKKGNLKKQAQSDVDTRNAEISRLKKENTALRKAQKGGITPVKDIITKDQYNAIFGLRNSVKSQINMAAEFAGGTPEAKELAKRANELVKDYVDTGSIDTVKELSNVLTELDNMAKSVNATYKSKNGNTWTYEQMFGDQARYLENMKPVTDIYNAETNARNAARRAAKAAESAPVNPTENVSDIDSVLDEVGEPPVGNPPEYTPYPDGGEKVRSFSRRGSMDETLPEEVRNTLAEDYYKVIRNADVEERANSLFDPNNTAQTRSNLKQALQNHDPAAASLSYKLAKKYIDDGNYDAGIDVLEEVSAELTRGGQFTQAAKLAMMQNDPMAAMRAYKRDLDSLNQWGNKKYKKKWNNLELSQEDIDLFNSVGVGDSEGLNNVVDQLNTKFGKEIPASWWDKAVAGSKTAMLLNMRTQGRNIVSNMAMLPLRSVSDRVAAVGQNIAHLINPDMKVTQSLTGGGKQEKEIATQIWDKLKDDITGENKMKDSVKSDVLSHRQIFNDDWFAKWIDNATNGGIQRLNERLGGDANRSTMETLSNFTYWLMGDFGDTPFVKKNFVNRLASYMDAQGINRVEDVPDDAIALATQEALKATFKDDNAFSNNLAAVKKKTGKFGEIALPFVKTPANLAMRGIDYSPVGLINTFRKLKSGAEASEVIDDLSKNLTGTAMIYLGYKLRQNGLLSGNYSDNSDEKAWQKQQGMLENALHIGDNYYTVDWAQPSATPLIIGSTIFDAVNGSDEENQNILDALNTGYKGGIAVANSWLNTSPLQSLSDMLGGGSYGGSTAENVANEIIEFPQRFIPAQLGATARTIDPVMRDTYTGDTSLTGLLGNQGRQLMAKIPFLSRTLPASYDTWGNERTRSDSTGEAFFAQNINPGQLGNKNETPIDAEIQRIYDATGDNGVFPTSAARSLDLGSDGNIKLTNEEHSEYQKQLGQLSFKFAEGLINSEEFKGLSDDEKASALDKAYKFANQVTKEDLFDHSVDQNKKLMEAYRAEGVDGAINYWLGNIEKKKSKEEPTTETEPTTEPKKSGVDYQKILDQKAQINKDYQASETVQGTMTAKDLDIKDSTYEKLGKKAGKSADKVYNAIPTLKKNGLNKSSAYYTYADAIAVDPNLTTQEFIKTFTDIDADKSLGIKQDELISYFNRNNVSQEDANKKWKMYGDSEWKKIPKLQGGKYVKVAK